MWRLEAGGVSNSCGIRYEGSLNVSGLYFWLLLEKGLLCSNVLKRQDHFYGNAGAKYVGAE